MKFYKYGCGCIGSPPKLRRDPKTGEYLRFKMGDGWSCMCLVIAPCDWSDRKIQFQNRPMTEDKIKEGHLLGEEEAEELTQEIASLVHDGYNMQEVRCLIGK